MEAVMDGSRGRYWETSSFRAMLGRAAVALSMRSAPVLLCEGDSYEHGGTCLPFRVGRKSFLITAGHVIDPAADGRRDLCVAVRSAGFPLQIPLDACFRSSRQPDGFDPQDLAVIPLSDFHGDLLRTSYRFTTPEEILSPYAPAAGDEIATVGYPDEFAQINARASSDDWFPVHRDPVLMGGPPLLRVSGKIRRKIARRLTPLIVAGYRRSAPVVGTLRVPLRLGVPGAPTPRSSTPGAPRAGGMSGGGMWLLTRDHFHVGEWNETQVRLLGITTDWMEHVCIVGTRAADVLEVIRRQFPSAELPPTGATEP